MTTISIAMATYNGERFLRQQLDSFSRQSVPCCELVVCDDRSTDSTSDILEDFSRSAPFPVHLVRNQERLGYTANFLKAAEMCQGNLIAFSDQDDEWLPNKIARLAEASRDSNALLFAHAAEWIDDRGHPMGVVYPTDRRFRKYLDDSDFPGHAIAIRKQLLTMTAGSMRAQTYKEIAGDSEFGHDVLFLELATAFDSVLFIPEVLSRWRVYSASGHAWTKAFNTTGDRKAGIAERLYPSDLAEVYAKGAETFRRHGAFLTRVIEDLKANATEAAGASLRLSSSVKLMNKRADVMALRAQLYKSQSLNERTKLLFQGASRGQYRSAAHGGVGIHNALRDLLAIVAKLPRPR